MVKDLWANAVMIFEAKSHGAALKATPDVLAEYTLHQHTPDFDLLTESQRTASSAPVPVSRLLSRSLEQLPRDQRERYAEEWAADLLSIHGRFARFRWQLGIRLTTRRLARSAAAHSPAHHG